MMYYLRRDGDYRIYLLEHWSEENQRWSTGGPYGHPPGFTASGQCWQETGVHGTYDLEQALDGAASLQKEWGIPFRVVALEISQRRVPVKPIKACDGMRNRPVKPRLRMVVRAVLDVDDEEMKNIVELDDVLRPGPANYTLMHAVRDRLTIEIPQPVTDLASVNEVMET